MRAGWYERNGAARDVLTVGELPTPQAGPGEVRVRVHASGINPSDVKKRAGFRGQVITDPRIIPHSDGAGIIDQLGPGVQSARLGERVWVHSAQFQRANGTAAEFVTVPAALATRLPNNTDFAAGACIGSRTQRRRWTECWYKEASWCRSSAGTCLRRGSPEPRIFTSLSA